MEEKNRKEILNAFLKVRVTKDFKKELEDYCDKAGITVSVVIRDALEDYMNNVNILDELKKI